MVDAFLTNCRLADGRLVDIGIAGGTIAAVIACPSAQFRANDDLDQRLGRYSELTFSILVNKSG